MKRIRVLLFTFILLIFLLTLNGCRNEESVEAEEESIPWFNGIYSGELCNALPNGHGIWASSSGETYDGEWEYGVRHGYGKWTNIDGESYEGGWSENLKHGTGKYTWSDGSTYEGEWEYDIELGFGKWTDADGNSYEGQFQDGLFHGEGVWLSTEGDKYEGSFEFGERQEEEPPASTDGSITTPRNLITGDVSSNIPEWLSDDIERHQWLYENTNKYFRWGYDDGYQWAINFYDKGKLIVEYLENRTVDVPIIDMTRGAESRGVEPGGEHWSLQDSSLGYYRSGWRFGAGGYVLTLLQKEY